MSNKRLLHFFTALLLSSAQHISLSAAQDVDADDTSSATTIEQQLRIFQTLPNDPADMTSVELSEMHRRLRATRAMVFGGSGSGANNYTSHDTTNFRLTLEVYTPAERREYLVKKGQHCYPTNTNIDASLQWKDVVTRYDSLMNNDEDAMTKPNENSFNNNDDKYPSNNRGRLHRLATELWKYCLLYNGDGHVYLGYDEAQLLHPLQAVLGDADLNYGVESIQEGGNSNHYLHDSFMAISPYKPAKVELSTMIRMLLETSNDVLALHPMLPSKMLHQAVTAGSSGSNNGAGMTSSSWKLLRSHCINVAKDTQGDGELSPIESTMGSNGNLYSNFELSSSSRSLALPLQLGDAQIMPGQVAKSCPLSSGGYCCLAFLPNDVADNPVIALRDSIMSSGDSGSSSSSLNGSLLPYKLEGEGRSKVGSSASALKEIPDLGVVPATDLPYISTVRLLHNHTSSMPSHPADSSNFFDILFENDCLPYTKQCLRCLKDVSNEAHLKNQGAEEDAEELPSSTTQTKRKLGGPQMDNACSKCHLECPCYCDVLCKIRPLPKEVVRTYAVNPPKYKKAVDRLVPKIIHQTWFEPLTTEKYPNFSRLVESWKKSGWEYYFYDDEAAREFLSTHFPPEVGEAYDSINPGAFKADLFRYCVLLIRGGVYADVDVLIETNLDDAIANDVGFMTPIDEPGKDVGHQSCLWNGFIASAPGHPFLVRTIEIVVNNIRNRFTSVDYDDMLCPNPILSVSHTVDTLFTCGPCILGAGINNLLGLHMQNQFEVGDVDIWQSERAQQKSGESISVHPDDPRLLVPGRTIILEQNKNDMGAHRFTLAERHIIVAATDMPDYDDRPSSNEHYSKTHGGAGIYGVKKLYTDTKRANEDIRFVVEL